MRRHSTAVLLAIPLLLPAVAAAQGTDRSDRSLYVSVVDNSGAPRPGLGADAFTVREDGQAREVLRASRATEPIDIAVLIDNSQAATPHVNDLRRALKTFTERMAKGGHNVALIGLADRPTIMADYTSNPTILARGVERIFAQPGSGTTLLDAIRETSRGLQKRGNARRAILVITTEGTDFSNPNHQRALADIKESGAAFHALVITRSGGANLTTEEARSRGIVLDEGTRSSGGHVEHLLSSMALGDQLARVAAELENQYHVVYARPGALVPPDKVDVSVKGEGLRARGTLSAEPVKRPGA
jgi:VWFA-related protein